MITLFSHFVKLNKWLRAKKETIPSSKRTISVLLTGSISSLKITCKLMTQSNTAMTLQHVWQHLDVNLPKYDFTFFSLSKWMKKTKQFIKTKHYRMKSIRHNMQSRPHIRDQIQHLLVFFNRLCILSMHPSIHPSVRPIQEWPILSAKGQCICRFLP